MDWRLRHHRLSPKKTQLPSADCHVHWGPSPRPAQYRPSSLSSRCPLHKSHTWVGASVLQSITDNTGLEYFAL